MIEGFKIDVTAEEIVRHLEGRIVYHSHRAAKCAHRATRLRSVDPPVAATDVDDDEEEDEEEGEFGPWWPGLAEELQRRAERHRMRERQFAFLRDRIATNEIYRLAMKDLRSLEWLPLRESVDSR